MGLTPALATKWTQTSPTVWRFDLRQGVKFHDGTPFTADDVIFTFKRAAGDGSDMKGYTNPIKEVRKVGDIRRRDRDRRAVSDPARHAHDAGDHEQEVVRGEQGRASGRSPQGHREHGQLQVERHRTVPPEGAPAVGAHGARQELQLVGQVGEQPRRGRVHADRQRRDARRGAALGRDRPDGAGAAAGRRAHQGRPASTCCKAPSCARSSSAWTRSATSCSSATSRARTRSRTCACAAPSTRRSTRRRSRRA